MNLDTQAGLRLEALALDEAREFARLVSLARSGDDRAVHQARKTLQRIRAIVRLLAPLEPGLARRENARLGALRRRLSKLRDSAARAETFRLLAARRAWAEHATALRALAALESQRHREKWARYRAAPGLWTEFEQAARQLEARVRTWPFVRLTDAVMAQSLRRARKQARRRIEAARGRHGRALRHDLRRKLRRYANMQRAAVLAQPGDDLHSQKLLALAKRCGHEGDLWIAGLAARREARSAPGFAAVALALDASRREHCRRHDAALLRSRCFHP